MISSLVQSINDLLFTFIYGLLFEISGTSVKNVYYVFLLVGGGA